MMCWLGSKRKLERSEQMVKDMSSTLRREQKERMSRLRCFEDINGVHLDGSGVFYVCEECGKLLVLRTFRAIELSSELMCKCLE